MDRRPVLFVIVAAALYGAAIPLTKILLGHFSPVAMAGILYSGAFIGLALFWGARGSVARNGAGLVQKLERKDAPWMAGSIIFGGILAPVMLMYGLALSSGFSTSLLSNLEGVATAIIAAAVFHEMTGKRLWLALACVTAAGVILSWNTGQARFDPWGPAMIALSMACWGADNNITRQISARDPVQIGVIKCLFAGAMPILLVIASGGGIVVGVPMAFALVVGALGYGASLVLFIKALEGLGASRTGAFFGLAPFIGAVASLVILRDWLGWVMLPAAVLMVAGAAILMSERHSHQHRHEELTHSHTHVHDDSHHAHEHPEVSASARVHEHTHRVTTHDHGHYPDQHHRHGHQ
jgi:drug/metabolite transporter (DMT)-like permease